MIEIGEEINAGENRDYINVMKSREPKTGVLFVDYINITVLRKQKRKSKSYGKSYQTLIHRINTFSDIHGVKIYTNSITESFMDDFIVHLERSKLKQSYICTLVSLIKSMARSAGIDGYITDNSYDIVDVLPEPSFSIFLSSNDITRIYYYQGLTRFQERIRDLFVIGCLTALRFSDYSRLTKDNFSNDSLTIVTQKTKQRVTVPLHGYVKEIYNKYDGKIPGGMTVQHFDRYIKKICKKIGFVQQFTYTERKGGEEITQTKFEYELISSHTARRSAATNMLLTGRMKVYEIMKFTGHTTEKNFYKYIKITSEDTADKLKSDTYFKI